MEFACSDNKKYNFWKVEREIFLLIPLNVAVLKAQHWNSAEYDKAQRWNSAGCDQDHRGLDEILNREPDS